MHDLIFYILTIVYCLAGIAYYAFKLLRFVMGA